MLTSHLGTIQDFSVCLDNIVDIRITLYPWEMVDNFLDYLSSEIQYKHIYDIPDFSMSHDYNIHVTEHFNWYNHVCRDTYTWPEEYKCHSNDESTCLLFEPHTRYDFIVPLFSIEREHTGGNEVYKLPTTKLDVSYVRSHSVRTSKHCGFIGLPYPFLSFTWAAKDESTIDRFLARKLFIYGLENNIRDFQYDYLERS